MAEERLIDDDKDRKYKIRINEDGEEELVITPDGADVEEEDIVTELEVPEFETDDEEAAVMTPEQLAARERAKREDEEARKKSAARHIGQAKIYMETPDYENALAEISFAEELFAEDGETQILKLKAVTRGFTDFSDSEGGNAAADGVIAYASEESRRDLQAYAPMIEEELKKAESRAERLNKENEVKRGEREEFFLSKRKRAVAGVACSVIPLMIFAILAGVFFAIMHSILALTYQILAIVFSSLAGIAFVAFLVFAHNLWDVQRKLKLNKSNSSSRLGRSCDEAQAQVELLKRVYSVVNCDDLSR